MLNTTPIGNTTKLYPIKLTIGLFENWLIQIQISTATKYPIKTAVGFHDENTSWKNVHMIALTANPHSKIKPIIVLYVLPLNSLYIISPFVLQIKAWIYLLTEIYFSTQYCREFHHRLHLFYIHQFYLCISLCKV